MKDRLDRISDRRGWYCDFSNEPEVIEALKKRLHLQLSKLRFYEVKPKVDISEERKKENYPSGITQTC
jgi:hypothetical protein